MSSLLSSITTTAVPAGGAASASAAHLGLLPLLAAGAVWCLEVRGRAAQGAPGAGLDCKRILRSCAPEMTGLMVCAAVAAAFLLRGDTAIPDDPSDAEAWLRIKSEWPLLTTADTLIAFQAMLRLPPLLSAAFRPSSGPAARSTALGAAPATLALAAAAARVALLVLSEHHRLDGPLGGFLHMAFEVAALPALVVLARSALCRGRCLLAVSVAFAAVACLAMQHRLALAEESPTLDALYTLAELLEFLTSAAYLARTVVMWGGPKGSASTLMHTMLPLQQGLSMYYLMLAFQDSEGLIGAGQPLALLKLSSTCQVFFYIVAATMHLTLCVEAPEGEVVDC